MKKLAVACLTLAALALIAGASWADLGMMGGEHFQMMRHSANNLAPGQYRPAAVVDTVWYGFVTGGTASTVDWYYPPSGHSTFVNWDFDRQANGSPAAAGTAASLQGWTPEITPYTSGSARPPVSRPDWFLNFGNRPWSTANYNFDNADTSHPFPYWHQQDMVQVPVHPLFGANQNIEGAGVLWCGMISKVAKEIMPEYISQTAACAINFPGYGDLWDQYVSHDFNVGTGGTTLTFKYAVDMDNRNDTGYNGGITTVPLQNGSAYDALSVWAGNPTASLPYGATIPNSADINDLLDATNRVNLSATLPTCIELDCNGWTGRSDSSGTSFTTATFGAGTGSPALASQVRVLFRVRTNRSNSDQYNGVAYNGTTASNPYQPGGSKYGAAEIDEVYFSNATGYSDGKGLGVGNAYKFNTALNMEGWTPSGKVLPLFTKTINVGNNDPNVGGLGYDPVSGWDVNYADPCGIPGSGSSLCQLKNNVLAMYDTHSSDPNRPRNHYSTIWPNSDGDMQQGAYSPPITIAGTPGFGRAGADINFDLYAYLPIDDAVFFWYWIRWKTPTMNNGGVLCPGWERWARGTSLFYMETPNCSIQDFDPTALLPVTTMTDVQVDLQEINYCWGIQGAWGLCSSNFSPLWDNVRFGMWQAPNAPSMAISDWHYWQDSYPVDNAIPYGSYLAMQKRRDATGSVRTNDPASGDFYIKNISVANAAIDAKTAVMIENATNNTREYTRTDGGVASGDSCVVQSSFSTAGRVDCVFRVLPGPLTDTTGPWFQGYISDIGTFGNNGAGGTTHPGGTWKWYVWNSVRLDTSEYDSWDSTANNATQGPGANPTTYATTIHEDDAHYATLGYNHCLPLVLTNPAAGQAGHWIAECSSAPLTKEHTPIFPSYVFTPGTVLEYFYRSSFIASPTVSALLPDTAFVYNNGSRYFLFRVLPNAWTDPTYGTPPWQGYGWLGGNGVGTSGGTKNEVVYKLGRPCVLFVNHSFGGGPAGIGPAYFPYHNTMDTLGITPFVDDYQSGAPSSGETGIGSYYCHDVKTGFTFVGSSGPSVKQLAGYGQIYYNSGYLTGSSIADAENNGDANADVQLFDAWLKLQGGRKGLWLNGTSIAQNLALLRPSGSPSQDFASNTLGVLIAQVDGGSAADNYRSLSGDNNDCPTVVAGGSVWNPAQQTGFIGNLCAFNYDVIPPRTDLPNSKSSQLYAIGSLSAGVVNSVSAAVSGTSKTLIDALDFPYVRNVSCYDAYGRIYHMRTLYKTYFTDLSGGFCPDAVSPVGTDSRNGITALFQNSPNPFRPNRATTIRYSIAKKSNVALNILDVSGRVVRTLVNASKDAGDYSVAFDGRSANGSPLASGVYFYRLKVGDFESNKKMLMLK